MTKKSAIAVALGIVSAVLVAAIAISMNYGIGPKALAPSSPTVVNVVTQQPQIGPNATKPIVTTRHVTIHRTKPGRVIPAPTITVAQPAPVAPAPPAPAHTGAGSGGGGGDHEGGGGGDHEGGDD